MRAPPWTCPVPTSARRCPRSRGTTASSCSAARWAPTTTRDHAWIGPCKDLLRDAVDRGLPTLGICLGHQLLASALGGRVVANPPGQQLGLLDVGWTDAAGSDPLTGPLSEGPARRGVHWNHDVVSVPPPGAEVLAATPAGEIQAVRFAPRAWGVQWHPEVDVPVLVSWAEGDRADHLERGIDQQALLDEIDAARAELDTAWRPLADRFLALLAADTP